jgi:hypothetical protein
LQLGNRGQAASRLQADGIGVGKPGGTPVSGLNASALVEQCAGRAGVARLKVGRVLAVERVRVAGARGEVGLVRVEGIIRRVAPRIKFGRVFTIEGIRVGGGVRVGSIGDLVAAGVESGRVLTVELVGVEVGCLAGIRVDAQGRVARVRL